MPKVLKQFIPFNKDGNSESINNKRESVSTNTEATMALEDEERSSISENGEQFPPDREYTIPDNGDDEEDYGYGDASPDIAIRKKARTRRPSSMRRGSTDSCVSNESGMSELSIQSAQTCPEGMMGRRSSLKMPGRSRRASIQISGEIEISLPGHDQPVTRRTSISFNETVKVKRVAPVHELTEEPEELWFQDDEYDKIRRKSFKIVDKFVQGEKIEGKKLCTRGLESILNHENRTNAKVDAWESVLNEQHMQREDGNYDDEYLSKVYKFSTRRSSNEAKERANQDEADVQKYLQSTRRICRRLTIS